MDPNTAVTAAEVETWPHDEYWRIEVYTAFLELFRLQPALDLAREAMTPADATDIHSDEFSLALTHVLAERVLEGTRAR